MWWLRGILWLRWDKGGVVDKGKGNVRNLLLRQKCGKNDDTLLRRRNWIQRHSRRPQTVNIDENTMSGRRV